MRDMRHTVCMFDMIRRLVWFGIVASAFSYAGLLMMGSFVSAHAAQAYEPTLIRDDISAGAHHLSGMIMVPSSCDQLSVRGEQVSDTTYVLRFTTWREPSVACDVEEVPRAFRTVVFAPATGVEFIATLDDRPISIATIVSLAARTAP